MKVLITGGSGFVGARLARELLQRGALGVAGAAAAPIRQMVLADHVAPPADLLADPRVVPEVGDLLEQLGSAEGGLLGRHRDVAVLFHLAAAVSGECEADFDLGMRSNLATTQALLAACRALGTGPTVFYASSIAVFGRTPERPFPDEIVDDTLPFPQTSYGTQKLIGEHLMADYARKGFIRARSARLATVVVRAGRPNGAASGFFSGMVREPLRGERSVVPVGPQVVHSVASPASTVEGILACVQASDLAWGPLSALNLPALPVTVGEIAQTLRALAGEDAYRLLEWRADPVVERIVQGWPTRVGSPRARALGLQPDASLEAIVRLHAAEAGIAL